jgi:tryptophan synthase alpha chain
VAEYRDQNPNSKLPIILMGYINPVLRYGIERFCSDAQTAGVDALILPDLPVEIYEAEYKQLFEKHQLSNILLITPKTSVERIGKIDSLSNGFIYAVSSASTTGSKSSVGDTQNYIRTLANMKLESPVLLGFNIKSAEDVRLAAQHLSGAIIGSAFIKAISDENYLEAGRAYLKKLK